MLADNPVRATLVPVPLYITKFPVPICEPEPKVALALYVTPEEGSVETAEPDLATIRIESPPDGVPRVQLSARPLVVIDEDTKDVAWFEGGVQAAELIDTSSISQFPVAFVYDHFT